MAGEIGLGTVTFGTSLVGVFSEPDGWTYQGKTVVEVDCTVDTDTEKNYAAGDIPDFGQFTATVFVDATLDMDAIVGTTDTLTWTLPSGNTKAGQAFLVSAPHTSASNETLRAAVTFRWISTVVTTIVP